MRHRRLWTRPRRTRRATFGALVLCTVGVLDAASAHSVLGQQQTPSFEARVDIVTLSMAVLDSRGLPAVDLRPDELSIVVDGVEHDVAFLLPAADTPLDIMLLLDLSGSMGRQPWQERTIRFLDSLSANDCVLLAGFSWNTAGFYWGPPTSEQIRGAVRGSRAAGRTALYDGLLTTIARFTGGWVRTLESDLQLFDSLEVFDDSLGAAAGTAAACPVPLADTIGAGVARARRRAVVVVTDGDDTGSTHGANDVLIAALVARHPIYAVTGTQLTTKLPRGFRNMVLRTGGRYVGSGDSDFDKLNAWLRGTYTAGFYIEVPSTAEFTRHEVAVKSTRADLEFVHAPVYYQAGVDRLASLAALMNGMEALGQDDDRALRALEDAVRNNFKSATAFFQKAEVLARLGRTDEALDDALTATRLAPGAARAHTLAAELAAEAGAGALAWDQAVRAAQAGGDVSALFFRLEQLSAPPENLERLLGSPRVSVAKAVDPAENLLIASATQSAVRLLRVALSDSPVVALVPDVESAQYRVTVTGEKVSDELPREFRAQVEIHDESDDRKYRGSVTIRDINDTERAAADLAKIVAEIEKRVNGG